MTSGARQNNRDRKHRDWIGIRSSGGPLSPWQFGVTLVVVAAALALAFLLYPVAGLENADLVFLTAIIAIAVRYGFWPSVAACILSALAYNFFFFPPVNTFAMTDPGNIATVFFFLVVAVATSHLAAHARAAALAAESRAETTEALYAFSRKIAGIVALDDLLEATAYQIGSMLRLDVMILLPDADGKLEVRASNPPDDRPGGTDAWAWDEDRSAGRGAEALFTTQHLFLPLRTSHGPVGAIGVSRTGAPLKPDEERLLAALVDQAAVAIERSRLAAEMDAARLAAETERLRTALLTSLSHDLKTPLASITGAATSLREYGELYDAAAREELAVTIQGESERLSRFVANLLDMTRLKAGGIVLKREPVDLGEAVGAALQRMRGVLDEHQVAVELPAGLPMLDLDVVLLEQVLVNLLDNASKYSAPGSTIVIGAACDGRMLELTISDEGSGIPAEDLERVFEMFYRVNKGDRQRAGTGLGLSICRGFVEVLGGTIRVANRSDRSGAVFTVTFPRSVFTTLPQGDAAE
ncbi:ATP-binding protein [Microvirga subterranea]|uniref:histidine kinase n=1 Tax=Microvirga subterranea TaxID=186651 RepID=A0A370HAK4_9HYPH|nr:ATP-binding protein [Microvirga subterranea]RDI53615.1 phospho-acceptor domain-containing protein [Microvirga subterranea]